MDYLFRRLAGGVSAPSPVPSSEPTREQTPAVPAWLLSTYRVFAYLTGVLLLTLTIALVALLGTEPKPEWYAISWTLHGWAYMGYLGSGFALSFLMRWSIGRTLLVLLAGTIPAMSFVAERWVIRNVAVRDTADADVTR
jgi:integral membrane protein